MRGWETQWGARRRRPCIPHGVVFPAVCASAPCSSLGASAFPIHLGSSNVISCVDVGSLPPSGQPLSLAGVELSSDASPGIEGLLMGAPFWKGLQGAEPACFLTNSQWGFLTLPAEFVQRDRQKVECSGRSGVECQPDITPQLSF